MSSVNDYSLEMGLPAVPEMERAILGGILLDNELIEETSAYIEASDFFHDSHRTIFAALKSLREHGKPMDAVTVMQFLASLKKLDSVGGVAYLMSLTEGVPRRSSLGHYLATVKEKSRARHAIAAANVLIGDLLSQGNSCDDALATHRRSLDALGVSEEGYRNLADFEDEVFARILHLRRETDELPGLSYGIEGINRATGGMYPGEVTVIGARTGVGKSSFALGSALAVAQNGSGVYYRSDEMRGQTTYGRTLSALSAVNGFKIRSPKSLDQDDLNYIEQAAMEMRPLLIGIDDKAKLHVDQVLARAAQKIRRERKKLCIFDFIQRMNSTGKDQFEKISYATRAIADFARATNTHCMILSQLKRMGRDSDGIPTMEDLKMTGELEENADCIVLLWRAPDTEGETTKEPDLAIIAKQRNGESDINIKLEFNKKRLLYQDYERAVVPYQPKTTEENRHGRNGNS